LIFSFITMGYPESWYCTECYKKVEGSSCPHCGFNPKDMGLVEEPLPSTPAPAFEKVGQTDHNPLPNFGAVFRVLVKPKVLEDLAEEANIVQGLILALAIYTFSSMVMYAASILTGVEISNSVMLGGVAVSDAISAFTSIIRPFVVYVVLSLLTSLIAGVIGGKMNISKTFGLTAYAQSVALVFLIAFTLLALLGLSQPASGAISGDIGAMTNLAIGATIATILFLVGLLWIAYISAKAVAIANGISTLKAFIIQIIVSMIIGPLIGNVTVF
jgi:hypothetical protein